MKRKRAFLLLEISCFGFLFLCSILPFLSFQKDVYRFVQKDKKRLEKEWDFHSMRTLLLKRIVEISEEETLYYHENIGWKRERKESIYEAKIKKASLFERENRDDIWYFRIYDRKKEEIVWEGFRFVEK